MSHVILRQERSAYRNGWNYLYTNLDSRLLRKLTLKLFKLWEILNAVLLVWEKCSIYSSVPYKRNLLNNNTNCIITELLYCIVLSRAIRIPSFKLHHQNKPYEATYHKLLLCYCVIVHFISCFPFVGKWNSRWRRCALSSCRCSTESRERR